MAAQLRGGCECGIEPHEGVLVEAAWEPFNSNPRITLVGCASLHRCAWTHASDGNAAEQSHNAEMVGWLTPCLIGNGTALSQVKLKGCAGGMIRNAQNTCSRCE